MVEWMLGAAEGETMPLSDQATQWLATGERGCSSESIFTVTTGIPAQKHRRADYPLDPDDLRRCLLLLESVPECQANFEKMREANCVWRDLVEHWDELKGAFLREAPKDWRHNKSFWRAPETYDAMNKILGRHGTGGDCSLCHDEDGKQTWIVSNLGVAV